MAQNQDTQDHMDMRVQRQAMGMRILAVIGAVFLGLLVLGFIVGGIMRHREGSLMMGRTMPIERGGHMGGMRFGHNGARTNQQVLNGVVTVVNGSSLTIAGGGVSNTVQTNDSTAYVGDTKPVVNDTVTVFGTTNNGAFIATQVAVN